MAETFPTIRLAKGHAVSRGLWAITAVLTVCSVLGDVAQRWLSPGGRAAEFARLWSLDGEQNIPTFFSMILMLAASALLALTTAEHKRAGRTDWRRWAVLSAGFLAMAYDEVCEVHEGVVAPLRLWLGSKTFGVFYFAWIIPAAILVLVIIVTYWRFIRALPAPFRRLLVIAASLFLGGALGLEALTGAYVESYGNLTGAYHLLSTIEEVLELAGLIVLLTALLENLASSIPALLIKLAA